MRKDSNFVLGRIYFTSNDGSQNTFIYQPTLDTLELKKDKGIDYALSLKSKGVYNSKLKLLYTAFLHSIKPSRYKMGIKFDKVPVAVKHYNYLIKIINIYIVYDLDALPKILLRYFTLKNCLFGVTSVVNISDKEKYVYGGYGIAIAFDGKSEWTFYDDYARNVVTFGVDNSSLSHADNPKNSFLILGEGNTFGNKGSFGAPEKKLSINFSKGNTKFRLSLHYNANNSYFFVNGKEICKFKSNNKNVNFPAQVCLGSISNGFSAIEFREVSLNRNVYDF